MTYITGIAKTGRDLVENQLNLMLRLKDHDS